MTPRDIFGIVVRTAGLLSVMWGLSALAVSATAYGQGAAVAGLISVVVGLYLLRGAPHLLDYAYPSAGHRRTKGIRNTPMQADDPSGRG